MNNVILILGGQSKMIVTWSTLQPINSEPYVEYGLKENQLNYATKAEIDLFTPISLYTYRALLTDLMPLTTYCK